MEVPQQEEFEFDAPLVLKKRDKKAESKIKDQMEKLKRQESSLNQGEIDEIESEEEEEEEINMKQAQIDLKEDKCDVCKKTNCLVTKQHEGTVVC